MQIKRAVILIALLFANYPISAQNASSIKGKIISQNKEPLPGASVFVLSMRDSSIITGTSGDLDGNFSISGITRRRILIKISFIGYKDKFLQVRLDSAQVKDLGSIVIDEEGKLLKEVTITEAVLAATQKGDTTELNSNAFKVNQDANAEDLVKKMPGITVNDGKIQAQGEDVKKILVDGKPFFGDDPSAVLKNLPADAIDKVQIFDRKSDQTLFTGFDDGNTTKTINIITKAQYKNGKFGRTYAGYGYEDVYKAGGTINFFNAKQRISVLTQSNNINEQNFSQEDLLGVLNSSSGGQGGQGGPPRGMMRRGNQNNRVGMNGNDAGQFMVNQSGGINTTHAAGINYVDNFKNKVDFNLSYFFNYTDNNTESSILRNYITDSGLVYSENTGSGSQNQNHRINGRIDWKIDSSNSLLIQPKFTGQIYDGNSKTTGANTRLNTLLNSSNNNFTSSLFGINTSLNALWRHSFSKKGRTLSVEITPAYNRNNGISKLKTITQLQRAILITDSVNQESKLEKDGFTSNATLTYTEPITTGQSLSFTYINKYNDNASDKKTRKFNYAEYQYSITDSAQSNVFHNNYLSHEGGLAWQLTKGIYNLTLGSNYQYAELRSNQFFPKENQFSKNFSAILPNAMLNVRFSAKRSIRMRYRTNTNPPSVDQLQNVVNNTNPLQLSAGNPTLKQDYSHNLFMRYSDVNVAKNSSVFLMMGGSITNNYVASNLIAPLTDTLINGIAVPKGGQFTYPVNVNGSYSLRSFFTYSRMINKIKSNLNLNLGAFYTQTPGMINNRINYSRSPNFSAGLTLSSNISQKIDFTIGSTTNYNIIQNTLQKSLNSTYINQVSNAKINLQPIGGLVLTTEFTQQIYSGLSAQYNQAFYLWNAGIGYKFLKDKNADLRFYVFDLLKQNTAIQRNTTETYFEDTRTNILQRYFMVIFTYNFRKFTGSEFAMDPDKPRKE